MIKASRIKFYPTGSPWLTKLYRHVPYPYASSFAQQIFQSGVVQSDTDFRIFRDFGNVPGECNEVVKIILMKAFVDVIYITGIIEVSVNFLNPFESILDEYKKNATLQYIMSKL